MKEIELHRSYFWQASSMRLDSRVARWSDEVETGMNAQVVLLASIRLLFLPHIQLMLVIDEINDGGP